MAIYMMRDDGGFTPTGHTVAYYPLNSTTTVNDQSGNNYNLTNNGGITFNSLGATFSANKYLSGSNFALIPQGNAERTYSIRFNQHSSLGIANYVFSMGSFVAGKLVAFSIYNNNNNSYIDYWDTNVPSGYVPTLNSWHNVVFTTSNSNQKFYIDGVLVGTSTKTLGTVDGVVLGNGDVQYYFDGLLSEFIVEDVAWTAQEVLDYYNDTKSNYGIS